MPLPTFFLLIHVISSEMAVWQELVFSGRVLLPIAKGPIPTYHSPSFKVWRRTHRLKSPIALMFSLYSRGQWWEAQNGFKETRDLIMFRDPKIAGCENRGKEAKWIRIIMGQARASSLKDRYIGFPTQAIREPLKSFKHGCSDILLVFKRTQQAAD